MKGRRPTSIVLATSLLLLGPSAQEASAAGRPDLTVASLSNPPASAYRGLGFEVTDTVRNQGQAPAGPSVTRYYLSTDPKKGGKDVLLEGSRPVGTLGPGKSSKGSVSVIIPKGTSRGRYHLLACADDARKVKEKSEGNNCTASKGRIEVRATSEDLIGEALDKGEIDQETALTYRVFAAFGDDRLPRRYRGDDSVVLDSFVLEEAAAAWDTLSGETQGLLEPFFIPPFHAGSWWDLAEGPGRPSRPPRMDAVQAAPQPPCHTDVPLVEWDFVESVNGQVKVWWQVRYPNDQGRAQAIANAMDRDLWPKLTDLMGRVPFRDGGSTIPCRGGDDRLDIALVDRGAARAPSYQGGPDGAGCETTPAFILIRRELSGPNLLGTLAHEFMHAIQWTYDVKVGCVYPGEYQWLAEATGTWAEQFVYGDLQTEQPSAPSLLNRPETSLEVVDGSHEYGAYLLPFFLANAVAGDAVVREIWDNTQGHDSLLAVSAAIQEDGGFESQWKEFTLYNWNREPVDFYRAWDRLTAGAFPRRWPVSLAGGRKRTIPLPSDVRHLAAIYHHLEITDRKVRWVKFDNTLVGVPNAGVYALWRLADGTWKVEDWTQEESKTFCRDKEKENLAELVLIFSNSSLDRSSVLPDDPIPAVEARNKCEVNGWTGTVTGTRTVAEGGLEAEETWTATVTFTLDRQQSDPERGYFEYETESGLLDYDFSQVSPGPTRCTGQTSVPIVPDPTPLPPDVIPEVAWADLFFTDGVGPDSPYYGAGTVGATVTLTCETSDGTFEIPMMPIYWAWFPPLNAIDPQMWPIVRPDGSLRGTLRCPEIVCPPPESVTWEWDLVAT